jgi:hypothetical protein
MKSYIVFLLFILSYCSYFDDGGYQESLDNQSRLGLLQILLGSSKRCLPTGYEISDLQDGRLRLSILGECAAIYYYKKCLQGQVFRKIENDCKGVGDISNLYGALQLRMCVENGHCFNTYGEALRSCNGNIAYFDYYLIEILNVISKTNETLDGVEIWFGTSLQVVKIPTGEMRRVNNNTAKNYTLCQVTP